MSEAEHPALFGLVSPVPLAVICLGPHGADPKVAAQGCEKNSRSRSAIWLLLGAA
jgi:hypothetical protein